MGLKNSKLIYAVLYNAALMPQKTLKLYIFKIFRKLCD